MANTIQQIAVVLVVAGAAVLVMPTAGFDSLAADRQTSLGVADDPNAVLGLVDRSAGAAIESPTDSTIVYGLNDNENYYVMSNLSASVDEATAQDGTVVTDHGLTASIRAGTNEEYAVVVECADDGTPLNGDYELTLSMRAVGEISIDATRTTDAAVEVRCEYDEEVPEGGTDDDGIESDGNVKVGEDSEVNGDVVADGNVYVSDGATINQKIESGGDVIVGEGAAVQHTIDADGDIIVKSQATVNQRITSGGNVTVHSGATVNGDITAQRTNNIACDAEVNGNVDPANSNECPWPVVHR